MTGKQIKVYEKLTKAWNGFNPDTLSQRILNLETPLVTVAQLSWYRTDRLLLTLNNLYNSISIPINVCLKIQEYQTVKERDKKEINLLLNKFYNHKLITTPKNEGILKPRRDQIREVLKEFTTPYIMTFDDDINFPLGGIEAALTVLELDSELGSCSLACEPKRNIYKLKKTKENDKHLKAGPCNSPIDYGDAVGAATQTIRREVYNTCEIDANYYIGCGDLDFCMQMRKAGWKVGMLNLPNLFASNNNSNSPKIYHKIRYNLDIIKQSRRRFMNKWEVFLSL